MLSPLLVTGHEFIGINSFLFVLLILCCLLIGGLLKRYRISYLPESGGSMVFGFVVGCFLNLTSDNEKEIVQFSPNLIFFVVLPPIILDAGYTLKRKDFFHNIGSILLLAVVGTVINNVVFGYLMFAWAKAGWVPLATTNPLECLLFGAVISCTDPVATLAMLGSKEVNAHPLLYSLVFGESVLNDAISIVLYKTFEGIMPSTDEGTSGSSTDDPSTAEFGVGDLFKALGTFIGISLGSVVVGIGVALLCCFIFRRLDLSQYPIYEFTLVTLFAYLSYFMAEMLYLSGIMSLFFASICLAHYNYYNISTNAQIATQESFKSIAQICETFVFAYIGITAGLSIKTSHLEWDGPMIVLTIVSCLIARAVNIFPLCALSNLRRKGADKITFAMQIPLWFAGLRGAVAFALSLSFIGPHVKLIVSSTLMLVLFTTIVGGGLTLPILRWTGMAQGSSAGGAESAGVAARDAAAAGGGDGHASEAKFELLEGHEPTSEDADGEESGLGREAARPSATGVGGAAADGGLPSARSIQSLRSSDKYAGWVGKFKRFDKHFMRRWFGGASSARGEASGIIDEYGAPLPLQSYPTGYATGETPSDHYHQPYGQGLEDQELQVRVPNAATAASRFQLNEGPSPYSPSPAAGPDHLVTGQHLLLFPNPTAEFPGRTGSSTSYAAVRAAQLAAHSSPTAANSLRQDEDELKSIFKSGASANQGAQLNGLSPRGSALAAQAAGYQPPSYNPSPNVPASAGSHISPSPLPTTALMAGEDSAPVSTGQPEDL